MSDLPTIRAGAVMSLFDLTGQVAIVTGATKGIGRAIAGLFTDHGARVVVSSRNQSDCEAVADTLNSSRGELCAIAHSSDISDRESLAPLVQAGVDRWGRIDTLVSNASLSPAGSIETFDELQFADVLTANVRNNAVLARLVIPWMREAGGGSMVFITASSGVAPRPQRMVYGTSKAALAYLAKTLAIDLGRYNIRANAVAPGVTRTEISKATWTRPDLLRIAVGDAPLGRIGEPDEVAACVLFLASKGGAYTTGQTILVDGGITLQGHEGISRVAEIKAAETQDE